MTKENFTFKFPKGGECVTMLLSPFLVKDTAIAYVTKQNEARGDMCLITNTLDELVAIAYCDDHMTAHFFVEVRDAQAIPSLRNADFDV